MLLADKNVVIYGAAGAISAAVARAFAAEGATVYLTGHNAAALDTVAKEITAATGPRTRQSWTRPTGMRSKTMSARSPCRPEAWTSLRLISFWLIVAGKGVAGRDLERLRGALPARGGGRCCGRGSGVAVESGWQRRSARPAWARVCGEGA